mmetsp:Transcript_18315/g.39586  ORF Transcript_18315/g.39586 Transcript_18315/m.39586 type:complete len:544 (+) Transcript_18315:99-1730(+)|eukprot:CAMPEP_0172316282 /NCGR_PEP_ID=MMETSP1058-20130122/27696_1 /TAXON_ID=83371 /ORGANISM="Detonula confervacea, Strain CCMP 353" /LENGTH=543 /DNA_ID=CAMNT_0013030555 /DNA_START=14 /DNA_END=1645 /DNA_ORIENTATION=-
MQQRNQQLGLRTEHTAKSREESEGEHQGVAEEMNFIDTAYTNATPHEQYSYEGMADEYGWPLSPRMSPSPVISNLFSSGYPFTGIGKAGDDDMDDGQPTSLTREEQANDTSYAMLASKRSAKSIASVDGKIQEPHLNDVLCGRGGSINSHSGNRVFRGWIAQRKESYMLAESKSDKSRVTSEIFQQVRDQTPPGRFLHKIVEGSTDPYNVSGWWIEIDDAKALAKISQALREGAPAFRALHGGKKGRKKQQSPSPQRRSTSRKQKKKDAHEVSSRDKRKAPPGMEVSPARTTQEVAPMPPLPTNTNGHELDVLFPTTNNIFATENGNGNLLNSYPLVHMGDYTASLGEVARAIPSPPTAKKPRASVPATEARPSGKCSTPSLPATLNTPMVSPGFSPYGEAKAAWDAIAFLPNLSQAPGNHSPLCERPRLQRIHSLSFSDGDLQSLSSFNNPFENDNGNHKQEPPYQPELEVSNPSEDPNIFPPPLATLPDLSFGRTGSVPGGIHHLRNSSRHRLTGRRDSTLSSKSWGSISNGYNSKRKSIG